VTGQVSTCVEKDFLSTFYIPLPGYPISYHIDNITTHCELMFKKNILVFGKYDLVFCYPDIVNEFEPGYSTVVLARTFCESILLTGSDTLEMLAERAIDIQPAFVQPLQMRIGLGKPLTLNPWERLKSFISRKTWVEVFIEGQIIAEITPDHHKADLDLTEPLPQSRGTIAEQDAPAIQQKETPIDPESLAEQVQKIISQHEQKKLARDETACRNSGQPGVSESAMPPVQEQPEVLTAAKATELVLNILQARDAAMARLEQHLPHYPAGIEHRAYANASYPGSVRYPAHGGCQTDAHPPALALLPDQIPSRPGLEVAIHNPPPKPPGAGG